MKKLIVILFVTGLMICEVNSQVLQQWVNTVNGTTFQDDFHRNAVIDQSGNVYVAGIIQNVNKDLSVTKYNSNGSLAWTKSYNGTGNGDESLGSLLLDNSGLVTVFDSPGNGTLMDVVIIKYNLITGDTIFTRRYTNSLNDYYCDAMLRSNGEILTLSTSGQPFYGSRQMITLTRYSPSGTFLTEYNHGSQILFSSYATDLAYYSTTDYFIPGGTEYENGTPLLKLYNGWGAVYNSQLPNTLHFFRMNNTNNEMILFGQCNLNNNLNRNILYGRLGYFGGGVAKIYEGPGNRNEILGDAVMDQSNNVTYAVLSDSGIGTGYDIVLMKILNSNADTAWVRRYNGPANGDDFVPGYDYRGNNAYDMVRIGVDLSGNVYVCGLSAGSGTGLDIVTLKYNSAGALLWSDRRNGSANGNEAIGNLRIDRFGFVYVSGEIQNNSTAKDLFVYKLSSTGALQWSQTYNGSANGNDYLGWRNLYVDSLMNVVLTGNSETSSQGLDMVTIKYVQSPVFAPQNLTVTAIAGRKINLNWTNPNPNTDFIRIFRTYNNSPAVLYKTLSGNSLSYQDTNLSNNVIYKYYVAASNTAGYSPASALGFDTAFIAPNFTTVQASDSGAFLIPANGILTRVVNIGTYDNSANVITDVNVFIDSLSHSKISDLVITLEHLSFIDTLIFHQGGLNQNMFGSVFDDNGDTLIQNGTSPYRGFYIPFRSLTRFNNLGYDGNWTLNIKDTVSGNSGLLYKWSINVQYTFVTSITQSGTEIPDVFKLYNNYPNPFNPVTKIKFDIPAVSGNSAPVKIAIYNILGEEVTVLADKQMHPGSYEVNFDASMYSTGVYFYRIEAGEFTDVKKMILVK